MNAIITGAGKGIGKAIAAKLHSHGYDLLLISRSKKNLEEVKKELLEKSPLTKIEICPANLSRYDWVKEIKKEQAEIVPEVIVNNVGAYIEDWASGMKIQELDLLFQLNFKAAVTLTECFLPKMKERKTGHVLNICSVAAISPKVDAVSYSISKSALAIWGRALREELKKDKIKVTNIFPGSVATPSWDGSGADTSMMLQVEDISNAVEYALKLSSNANCDEIHLNPLDDL